MRISARLGWMLLLACAAAAPAQAGLRAVYYDAGKSKQLVIEIADNGDARIGEAESGDYGLLIGGHFIVVGDRDGKPMVARIEDVGAAIDRVVPPIFRNLLVDPASAKLPAHLKAEAGDERQVGGRTGRSYRISGFAGGDAAQTADYVISNDPELAPVGRVLEQFMNAALVPAAVLVGPAVPQLIGETREIFALGTPIDISGRFRLDRTEKIDVPRSRFTLPASPATVEALVASMKTDMQENAHR